MAGPGDGKASARGLEAPDRPLGKGRTGLRQSGPELRGEAAGLRALAPERPVQDLSGLPQGAVRRALQFPAHLAGPGLAALRLYP